jgi:hypothetical protein
VKTVTTDGSYADGVGGCAWVSGDKSWSERVFTNDSHYTELYSIAEALRQAEGDICIVTDHWGTANELRDMRTSKDWVAPTKYAELWDVIKENKHKLMGAEWKKRDSTPDMRKAHELANEARRGR